jgi:hypothetical protein
VPPKAEATATATATAVDAGTGAGTGAGAEPLPPNVLTIETRPAVYTDEVFQLYTVSLS